jgi:protein TonB
MTAAQNSSISKSSLRPALLAVAVVAAMLAACGKSDDAAAPGTAASPTAPPAQAVSSEVAALNVDTLRDKAAKAYQDSRLYAPAGDNAMEYYLALRDKAPGDPGASSALIDLLPMTVIATEQSRDREDFVEAQRLYGLIEKADKSHPALARLKASIAAAQDAFAKRGEQEKLTAEQELARKAELEKERLAQQQQQQQQAAQQLAAQQTEQAAAAQREADQKAAAQREADQKAAAAAARPAQPTASQPAASTAQPPAPKPAATAPATAADLRAVSTPQPRYPMDALRAGQSGEVQIEFTVATDGSVTNARVVRATPPRVFDREALAAVKKWRFEPISAPTTTRRTIGFNPGQ